MKVLSIVLLAILISVSAYPQSFLEMGGETVCVDFPTNDDESYIVLRIINPVVEIQYQTIKKSDLDTLPNQKIRVVLQEAHYMYFNDSCQALCDGQSLCISRELIPEWSMDIDSNSFGNREAIAIKIEIYPIKEQAKIMIDTLKDSFKLSENTFYIPQSSASKFKAVSCCKKPRKYTQQNSIEELEFRLRDLGYNILHNSRFDSTEIKALTDFQMQHHIQSGKLDEATLTALGLSPWPSKGCRAKMANIEWLSE